MEARTDFYLLILKREVHYGPFSTNVTIFFWRQLVGLFFTAKTLYKVQILYQYNSTKLFLYPCTLGSLLQL